MRGVTIQNILAVVSLDGDDTVFYGKHQAFDALLDGDIGAEHVAKMEDALYIVVPLKYFMDGFPVNIQEAMVVADEGIFPRRDEHLPYKRSIFQMPSNGKVPD